MKRDSENNLVITPSCNNHQFSTPLKLQSVIPLNYIQLHADQIITCLDKYIKTI